MHQTVEDLGAWLAQQLAAGRDWRAHEDDFRLYVLAREYQGHDFPTIEGHLVACGLPADAANWLVLTTRRSGARVISPTVVVDWEVMGRRMGLQHASPGELYREATQDRLDRRLREARRLARGNAPPDPLLDFDDQMSPELFGARRGPENRLAVFAVIMVAVLVIGGLAVALAM